MLETVLVVSLMSRTLGKNSTAIFFILTQNSVIYFHFNMKITMTQHGGFFPHFLIFIPSRNFSNAQSLT